SAWSPAHIPFQHHLHPSRRCDQPQTLCSTGLEQHPRTRDEGTRNGRQHREYGGWTVIRGGGARRRRGGLGACERSLCREQRQSIAPQSAVTVASTATLAI